MLVRSRCARTADMRGSLCSLGDRGRGAEPAFLGGDSVPAQIGDMGHVFKAMMGFWFPTLRVVDEGYMRVRVGTAARANSPTVSTHRLPPGRRAPQRVGADP